MIPWLAVTVPQAGDLGPAHDSGIGVWEQSGLAQHERAHRLKIIDRGFVRERVERLPRGAVAQLRLVAEREQRLRAARRSAGASDRKHFVCGKVGGLPRARALGEGAIVADVSTKMRERNEHLARIRDVTRHAPRRADGLRPRSAPQATLAAAREKAPRRSNRPSQSPYEAVRHDPRHVGGGRRMTLYLYDVASLR